jgi:hypothetical protein
MAELSGRSYEQMRVAILGSMDAEVFHVSIESCVFFLDPMIDSWDIDFKTLSSEIVLNTRSAPGSLKRFDFVEIAPHLLLPRIAKSKGSTSFPDFGATEGDRLIQHVRSA